MSDFKYHARRFSVKLADGYCKINWTAITQIDVYNKDLITTDIVMMDTFYGDSVLTIHEEMLGWDIFVKHLEPALPEFQVTVLEKLPILHSTQTMLQFIFQSQLITNQPISDYCIAERCLTAS